MQWWHPVNFLSVKNPLSTWRRSRFYTKDKICSTNQVSPLYIDLLWPFTIVCYSVSFSTFNVNKDVYAYTHYPPPVWHTGTNSTVGNYKYPCSIIAWLKEKRRLVIAHKIGSRDYSLNDVTRSEQVVGEEDSKLFTMHVWRHPVLRSRCSFW